MAGRRYRVEGGDLCAAKEEKEEPLLEEELLPAPLDAGVARGWLEAAAAGEAAAVAAAAAPIEAPAAGLEAAVVGARTLPGLLVPAPEHAPGLATVAPSALARQSLSNVLASPVAGTVAQTGM